MGGWVLIKHGHHGGFFVVVDLGWGIFAWEMGKGLGGWADLGDLDRAGWLVATAS